MNTKQKVKVSFATTEVAFTPVLMKHAVLGEKMATTQAELETFEGLGFVVPSVTIQAGQPIQQRTQNWTTDITKPKAVAKAANESRRTVFSDAKVNDSFAAKVIRFKIVNEGQPDAYADAQVQVTDGRKTCVAFQDFMEIGLAITITAVPRLSGDGLRWNSSL